MANVVLVLPTYNEKENLKSLIPLLEKKIFPQISKHKMNILIVDDRSPDGTANEIKSLMQKNPNLHLNLGSKEGLGAAYFRGMNYAIESLNADILISMDADGQHDARVIPEFLKKIDQNYDVVIGSRYIPGGSIPNHWGIHRKILSVAGNVLINTTVGKSNIHDWTSAYRAIKKEVFLKEKQKIKPYKDYTFLTSFLYEANNDKFKICEVPIQFGDRQNGQSKMAATNYAIEITKFLIKRKLQSLFKKNPSS